MQIRPEMQAVAGSAVGVARGGRMSSQIGRYGEYGMNIGTRLTGFRAECGYMTQDMKKYGRRVVSSGLRY